MGYVPLVVAVGTRPVSPRLGELLPPGDPRNPFSTTRALLMDRWIAAWVAMGTPDALQHLLPQLHSEDMLNILKVWRALLEVPAFVTELRDVQARCTPEWFGRHIRSLHVRILLLLLATRVIRVNLLHADELDVLRVSFPFFIQPNYELAAEITVTGKLHPWLRPSFVINPGWLNRRSRWCLTALHTVMCILRRVGSVHRPWVRQACFINPMEELAGYTRVPVGHVSTAPSVLRQAGLYIDPTVTALLPCAAANVISLLRDTRLWLMYTTHNKSSTFEALEISAGLRAAVQWRFWQMIPGTEPPACFLKDEPLYTAVPVAIKKSSAMAHVREVHFEMYRRWINMPKRQLELQPDHLFDMIMGPLEEYLHQRLAPCFDWIRLKIDPVQLGPAPATVPVARNAFFDEVAASFSEPLLAVDLEEK